MIIIDDRERITNVKCSLRGENIKTYREVTKNGNFKIPE